MGRTSSCGLRSKELAFKPSHKGDLTFLFRTKAVVRKTPRLDAHKLEEARQSIEFNANQPKLFSCITPRKRPVQEQVIVPKLMSWTALHPELLYLRRESLEGGHHDISRNNDYRD
jgi:hypothetical protein